ncbi:MAG: acetyl-CoA carboxylase biotin carboxyl carrier protein [Acidobacteria bacterium]|nr:acetyl-CoA carboxylase biotin carboxyl carrier protein [Acidobacteriota bacterium]
MTLEEIKQLIELVNDSGIAELELERGGNRVRIRRSGLAPSIAPQEIVLHPSLSAPVSTGAAMPASPCASSDQPCVNPVATTADPTLQLVKAPIVGTFYECPKPGSPAFVKTGDTVQAGQVLCIIEAMKLMNEIGCETAGVIVAKLVENGRPVEYGEALFSIRPL